MAAEHHLFIIIFILLIPYLFPLHFAHKWGSTMKKTPSKNVFGGVLYRIASADKQRINGLLRHRAGDLNWIQELDSSDRNIALLLATENSQWVVTSHLLDIPGINVNERGDWNTTPLLNSCTKAPRAIIQKLVKSGADPLAQNCDGKTALHLAIANSDPVVFKCLVGLAGLNLNVRDRHRCFTPLHIACERFNPTAVKLLLEHGADATLEDQSGNTPLQIVAAKEFEFLLYPNPLPPVL